MKLAAGQADGIQPRTIEVLQVCCLLFEPEGDRLIEYVELRLGRTAASRRQSNARGGEHKFRVRVNRSGLIVDIDQAFYNPNEKGEIEVCTPFPAFEVKIRL